MKIVPVADETPSNLNAEAPAQPLSRDNDVVAANPGAPKPDYDSLTAVGALSDTLNSANEIVDILIRGGLPTGGKPSLWIEVAECEKRTADLLHRIAFLRRKLFT